jgi:hypothetical protein
VQVRFDAPLLAAAQTASPLGKLMVFAKLYDVAPDGSRTLVKDLVAAARIPDVTKPAASRCRAWCTASPRATACSWCSQRPTRRTRGPACPAR